MWEVQNYDLRSWLLQRRESHGHGEGRMEHKGIQKGMHIAIGLGNKKAEFHELWQTGGLKPVVLKISDLGWDRASMTLCYS